MATERPTPPDFLSLKDAIVWQIERSRSEDTNKQSQRKCDKAIKEFKKGNPNLAHKLIQQELESA